jgi:hypothetical protein
LSFLLANRDLLNPRQSSELEQILVRQMNGTADESILNRLDDLYGKIMRKSVYQRMQPGERLWRMNEDGTISPARIEEIDMRNPFGEDLMISKAGTGPERMSRAGVFGDTLDLRTHPWLKLKRDKYGNQEAPEEYIDSVRNALDWMGVFNGQPSWRDSPLALEEALNLIALASNSKDPVLRETAQFSWWLASQPEHFRDWAKRENFYTESHLKDLFDNNLQALKGEQAALDEDMFRLFTELTDPNSNLYKTVNRYFQPEDSAHAGAKGLVALKHFNKAFPVALSADGEVLINPRNNLYDDGLYTSRNVNVFD